MREALRDPKFLGIPKSALDVAMCHDPSSLARSEEGMLPGRLWHCLERQLDSGP